MDKEKLIEDIVEMLSTYDECTEKPIIINIFLGSDK